MVEKERWDYLVALDDELLRGGVMLSEWCSFIVREADTAFAHGAFLAAILTTVSAIETYLRTEYSTGQKNTLCELIDQSDMEELLKKDLHQLRRYRNQWVHVACPEDDEIILNFPEQFEQELEMKAIEAVKILRKTIYNNQFI